MPDRGGKGWQDSGEKGGEGGMGLQGFKVRRQHLQISDTISGIVKGICQSVIMNFNTRGQIKLILRFVIFVIVHLLHTCGLWQVLFFFHMTCNYRNTLKNLSHDCK